MANAFPLTIRAFYIQIRSSTLNLYIKTMLNNEMIARQIAPSLLQAAK